MKHSQQIKVKDSGEDVTIEIDRGASAAYVRFRHNVKVAKTKTIVRGAESAIVCTADMDANGEVIGIEMVGVTKFSLNGIIPNLPPEFQNVDFRSAEFFPLVA